MRINRLVARHWSLLSSPLSSVIHASFGVFLQPQRSGSAAALPEGRRPGGRDVRWNLLFGGDAPACTSAYPCIERYL